MRHAALIIFCLAALLTACTSPTDSSQTPELAGIPTFETPQGLLPANASSEPGAGATMQPVDATSSQAIDTPDLGVNLSIPAEWSSQRAEGLTTIVDANGGPMLEIGQVFGFSADMDQMGNQMNEYLLNNGLKGNSFTIRQNVVNRYGYLVVSGKGIDACQYVYLPVGLSAIAFRFEHALCEADGTLNDTAFEILKSVQYAGPTE